MGETGQKKLSNSKVRLVGSGDAFSACRLYLERGGLELMSSLSQLADLEIHFQQGPLRARDALLVSPQEDGTCALGLWNHEIGPCADCLWKELPTHSTQGNFLDGATAATAAMILILEPRRWEAGSMARWGHLSSFESMTKGPLGNSCSHNRQQGEPHV